MKRCRHCRSIKPLDAFPSDTTRPDGRIDFCRRCWFGDKEGVAKKSARNEAINRLIARHRTEFDAIVADIQTEALPL